MAPLVDAASAVKVASGKTAINALASDFVAVLSIRPRSKHSYAVRVWMGRHRAIVVDEIMVQWAWRRYSPT
jgi:hypothetical protein